MVDIRNEDQVAKAFEDGVKKFGGIDILINNASAISLTGTLETPMKKYDLMNGVNARGTYLCSKYALPHLKKSSNPHILTISPPLNLNPKWFKNHVAYTIAKYGMSMCVLGMSEEFKDDGVAVNALWPKTAIETAAIDLIASNDMRKQCRTPEIMADAAYAILTKESRKLTGQFLVDEDVLKREGVTDFEKYSVVPGSELLLDFFLDHEDDKNLIKKIQTEVKEVLSTDNTDLSGSLDAIKRLLTPELVKKINGIYSIQFTDAQPNEWYLDLKNGNGDVGQGTPKSGDKAACTMTLKKGDFVKMVSGQLKPTAAFMTGKLKIKGDMGLAMKLEKVLSSVKSKL